MRNAVLFALLFAVAALGQQPERGVDRPGHDYRDFDLSRPDPGLCRAACTKAEECQAWTYVKPGAPGEPAHCWLKNEVPDPQPNEHCVSGVKSIAEQAGMEKDTNRAGDDYRDFELEQPRPALCRTACAKEGECRAWTYVKPCVQGDLAHCWLKNKVPEPHPDESCVSGVKRAESRDKK